MDTSPSQDSSLDYKSAADICDVQSTESWLGLGGSEEAGVGPSRRHMASSPMSISDSLQCMALDSDFSDVEDDLGVALKTRRRGNIREAGPLLGANDASLLPDLEEPAVSILSVPSKCAEQAEEFVRKQVAGSMALTVMQTFRLRIRECVGESPPVSPRQRKVRVDPWLLDPRNPDAMRPRSSKSIPSKCSRYVLLSRPRTVCDMPTPTALEEELLASRFPSQSLRLLHSSEAPLRPTPTHINYGISYTPFPLYS